ncbi:MAG: NAD(P)-binding domain-containing protein [Candidatus Obscuribacter sp.]|nr:NAD(P)-binding domain-containing protein [Candidatus Obscuribacter sp.]
MNSNNRETLLVIGVGNVGEAIARAALQCQYSVYATTRSEKKAEQLSALGLKPIIISNREGYQLNHDLQTLLSECSLVYTIAPEAKQDDLWLEQLSSNPGEYSRPRIYISSTTVYGGTTVEIDETTATAAVQLSSWSKARMAAEERWRGQGANIVRISGFYGPFDGPVDAMLNGSAQIADEGLNWVSLIHLDDLAVMTIKALQSDLSSRTLLAADGNPARQIELYRWLSRRLDKPMPPTLSAKDLHPSLKVSRKVNPTATHALLNFQPQYPNFEAGFEQCLAVRNL